MLVKPTIVRATLQVFVAVEFACETKQVSQVSSTARSSNRVARALLGSSRQTLLVVGFPPTAEQLYRSSGVGGKPWTKRFPCTWLASTVTSSYRVSRALVRSPRRAGFPCTWLTATATSSYRVSPVLERTLDEEGSHALG